MILTSTPMVTPSILISCLPHPYIRYAHKQLAQKKWWLSFAQCIIQVIAIRSRWNQRHDKMANIHSSMSHHYRLHRAFHFGVNGCAKPYYIIIKDVHDFIGGGAIAKTAHIFPNVHQELLISNILVVEHKTHPQLIDWLHKHQSEIELVGVARDRPKLHETVGKNAFIECLVLNFFEEQMVFDGIGDAQDWSEQQDGETKIHC